MKTDLQPRTHNNEITDENDSFLNKLSWAEFIIRQTHYEQLSVLGLNKLSREIASMNPVEALCLFKINELVFDSDNKDEDKLISVFKALHACGASALIMLKHENEHNELYIGAINKQRYENSQYRNTIREVLLSSIQGNLPGTELTEFDDTKVIQSKLDDCLFNDFNTQCVSSISCVARENSSGNMSGIERLLEISENKNFTLLIIADPLSRLDVENVKLAYEELSTKLSQAEQINYSLQTGTNSSISVNYSESLGNSIGKSVGETQNHTVGSGWSKQRVSVMKSALIGTIAMSKNPFRANPIAALFPQPTDTHHEDYSSGTSNSTNMQIQVTRQEGGGETTGTSEGQTISYTYKNRRIKELNNQIDDLLKWINERENCGVFNCCAYVLSGSASTNLLVASQYQALMQGKGDVSLPCAINTWTRANDADSVLEYLRHFSHPSFAIPDINSSFTPGMLMSSIEVARHAALPKKSVLGVTVSNYTSFGREVSYKSEEKPDRQINIGSIVHMGKVRSKQPVLLNLESLSSHTFIAGTNGSGKSNTVFKLLEELKKNKIPFFVIEPAKGEYKNVFGHDDDVFVYGTNRKKTPLLRLNLFWFNEGTDIKEHIVNLMSVFTACWSMYDAMPSVLNTAIENAYRSCGWNLKTSRCSKTPAVYPVIEDVIAELNKKMESTSYSNEVKGNYIGALSTRLEALSSGIYADVFGEENISDEELFERNVIVDLSRVGSVESKALFMGILVNRLVEFNQQRDASNSALRHVTVLEEAHNLLPNVGYSHSAESSDMLGKSVEMISSAIAEMRSYGEGFIIADQSPGMLDKSVIRNTNTKIILCLPDEADRNAVGTSMGLTADQIFELSRLRTGVCAIYQKNWLEAVLCKADLAKHKAVSYVLPSENEPDPLNQDEAVSESELTTARGKAFEFLLLHSGNSNRDPDRSALRTAARQLASGNDYDIKLGELLHSAIITGKKRSRGELSPYSDLLLDIIGGPAVWDTLLPEVNGHNPEIFDTKAKDIFRKHIVCDDETMNELVNLFLQTKGSLPRIRMFYSVWKEKCFK
ncbi:MAG: DUF87 domain-containing protein [Clostridia bacterium]|nr:DUF87 domain-containing protein [Clostridia bacterium]